MAINLDKKPLQHFARGLSNIKYIQLIQNDLNMLDEIDRFDHKKYYLNQAYIIHLVSQWQVFIEDLIEYGLNELLIKSNKNNNMGAFVYVVKKNYDQQVKRFNTPNLSNIDNLFENTLGIEDITCKFQWDTMTRDKAAQILDDVLKLRHKIAHTGVSDVILDAEKNFKYMKHLYNLAYILQYTVDEEIGNDLKEFEIPYRDNVV